MKLIRIEIENFGKLSGVSFRPDDGVTVLCEKNGWGKSTLAVFIKAMLYGLPATTKRDLDRNERKKYTPWQGGAYGGSIEFESEKGHFRAERFFGAKEAADEFRLFDLATNKPSQAYSANLGTELFGIDADGFERSTYLSQREIDASNGAASITTKLTGLLDDVNDIGSFEVAMKAIDKERQIFEVKGGRGRVADLKNELSERQAEAARCRDLLPALDDLKKQIAQNRTWIKQTEEEQQSTREEARKAELLRARMGEGARMQKHLAKAEAHRAELLQAFREQKLPTDSELTQARNALLECRQLQTERKGYLLQPEEQAQLTQLRTRYRGTLPSSDAITHVHRELQELSNARSELRALGGITEKADRRFEKNGIPSPALLNDAAKALVRMEEIEQQGRQSGNLPSQGSGKRASARIVGWGALVLGGISALLGAFLSALRLPCLIAGGALILVGVIWLAVSAARQKAAWAPLQEERAHIFRMLCELLDKYGYSATQESNLRELVRELTLAAKAARESEVRAKGQADAMEKISQRISQAQININRFFASVGYSETPRDALGALMQVRSDISDLNRLQVKLQKSEEKLRETDTILKEKQTAVNAFLSRFLPPAGSSNRPEELLNQIEGLCSKHATILWDIGHQKKEYAEFMAQNRNKDGTVPSAEAFQATENEQTRCLQALREETAELSRRLDRISDQTQRLPEAEDEIARLSEELKTAQESLKLLRRTADFLSDAKEALSTRYLTGVQTYFTRYCELLEGAPARAAIDTDFQITATEGGKSRALESFSNGKRDILQFCARLALTKAMFEGGEAPFLLLDDPFVNLDEENLTAARKLLNRLSSEFQILYFICHSGRM